ncbi:MAG: glycosyltransferase family 4 protein [Chloroflexota bacterium]
MRLLVFNLATDIDDPILGFTTHWIRALARRVERVQVITMRAGRLELPNNVGVDSVGKEKGYSEARRVAEFYRILTRVLREQQPDMCFSHMMPLFTVLGAPLLKLRKIPIITWYAHPHASWALKAAHRLSNRMVASVTAAYPYKKDKLVPIGHGIDTQLFCPTEDDIPDEPPMILCVGRLSPVKDHPTLLKAAAQLRQVTARPFRVVIVGGPAVAKDEAYVRALHEQIGRLKLRDIVAIEAPVPMGQLPQWYRRCAVHVNMSPLGFGDKVAWEAMSCARPCVVANEGFYDTLGKYRPHLIYEFGNDRQLAEKLGCLLALPNEERRHVGVYLRAQVLSLHRVDRLAQRLLALFATLRSKQSRTARQLSESR